jgi:hypothetical protein
MPETSGNGNGLPRQVTNILSSAYYAIAVTAVLVGALVYLVNLHNQMGLLSLEYTKLSKQIEDIDLHGTRTFPVIEQRLTTIDLRSIELSKELSILDVEERRQNEKIEILLERQHNVLRRLDKIEGYQNLPSGPP